MRRLPVIVAVGAALAVPVVALAATGASQDGSLVVHNGQAPVGTPVLVLSITGSVIGNVDHGTIKIDGGPLDAGSPKAPQVTSGARCVTPDGDTKQTCKGDNFSFRAVGGHYTLLVYGTGVDVVAVGTGWGKIAGIPDLGAGDGKYSVNGADFVSLPGLQTDKLLIGTNG
ncbi:MAG TPA: hypothetical protein VGH82_07550 [Gaiellaceae bacterium]|jgi:hypothetical protein